jgi:hypothetical protein
MKDWNVSLYKIESEIGEFLSHHSGKYDFIHMSHVIEHIPKYSLFWIVDAGASVLLICGHGAMAGGRCVSFCFTARGGCSSIRGWR